eukprot:gene10132-13010_t
MNLRAKQYSERDQASSNPSVLPWQTIVEGIALRLRMWHYPDEVTSELKFEGADFVNLTTSMNEAFVLGCLYWVAADTRKLSKAGVVQISDRLCDHIKSQRMGMSMEQRDFFKAQRAIYFRKWNLTVGRGQLRARDKHGRFSGEAYDYQAAKAAPLITVSVEDLSGRDCY